MAFHDIRFPANLSFGSIGGPERRTEIVTLTNGFEERNSPWAHSRRRYDAGMGLRSLDDMARLLDFFEARGGQLFAFRWKDWSDFKSCTPTREISFTDQIIGEGDNERTVFALSKAYVSGPGRYMRPITKPVADTVRLGLGGIELTPGRDFTVDTDTGDVRIMVPPPAGVTVTTGFEFDVPVRFDTDRIAVSVASFKAGELPQVPVIEVRV